MFVFIMLHCIDVLWNKKGFSTHGEGIRCLGEGTVDEGREVGFRGEGSGDKGEEIGGMGEGSGDWIPPVHPTTYDLVLSYTNKLLVFRWVQIVLHF